MKDKVHKNEQQTGAETKEQEAVVAESSTVGSIPLSNLLLRAFNKGRLNNIQRRTVAEAMSRKYGNRQVQRLLKPVTTSTQIVQRQSSPPPVDENPDTEAGWPPKKTRKNHYWDKLPVFQLSAEVSTDLLGNPLYASRAPEVLNGYWIKDIFDAVKLIKDKHSKLAELSTQAPDNGKWPRVACIIALVRDPVNFDIEAYANSGKLSAAEYKTLKDSGQIKEIQEFQEQQSLREWPRLLNPPKGTPALPKKQREAIYAKVKANRDAVQIRPDLKLAFGKNIPKPYHQGLYYTRDKTALRSGAEPNPTNNVENDPARTAINKEAWKEVLTEGSAASINTYDSQLLTVGRGFGAKGVQGREVLETVFASDPLAREAMLDVGFAMVSGKVMALDVNGKRVLKGDTALRHIELNKAIFSHFMNTFEQADHMQEMVNAQWTTLRNHAANIPEEVFKGGVWTNPTNSKDTKTLTPWDTDVIRFGVHANHFAGGVTWGRMIKYGTDSSGKGDIIKIARMVIPLCSPKENRGGAKVLTNEESRVLEWGNGIFLSKLGPAGPLPKDIDTNNAYNGKWFFKVGNSYRAL